MYAGGVSYGRILKVKHTEPWSLWDRFRVTFIIIGSGILLYVISYNASYKEILFLGGLAVLIVPIPLWIGLYRWWTDPRNATLRIRRWEFEAWKEEAFLDWCQTQKWYGTEGNSSWDCRMVYRADIEDHVRSLDPVELFEWCREHLEEPEKTGFWKNAGEFLAGVAGLAMAVAGLGDLPELFDDE